MKLLALFLLATLPLQVNQNTKLPPNGEYHRQVIITADKIVFDCNGSTFIGDGTGVGILIQRRNSVTVRNCRVRNFDIGLYAESGNQFVFERNDLSGNYVDDNYPIEDLKPLPHGGMILNGVQTSRIQSNAANGNIAGIQVLNSTDIKLLNNSTSRNRGWGIYLYGTTASSIFTNTAEYNNRNCWSGKDSGCGSAGVVLTEKSDRNKVAWNTLTYNGDGIYQGNTPSAASNDNEIYNNLFAHNVANGIEATFSFRNHIHHNSFASDNYGGWFGYSQYLRFEYNQVRGAHVKSVQADNAQYTKYIGNTFDGAGVLLQPWQGGTCTGNSLQDNILVNSEIVTAGCQ